MESKLVNVERVTSCALHAHYALLLLNWRGFPKKGGRFLAIMYLITYVQYFHQSKRLHTNNHLHNANKFTPWSVMQFVHIWWRGWIVLLVLLCYVTTKEWTFVGKCEKLTRVIFITLFAIRQQTKLWFHYRKAVINCT